MKNDIFQLFFYSSLRSGFRNPMYHYLTQYFHLKGEAVVKGRFFDRGEYPVALPTTEDHFITGELYEVNNPDEFSWALEQLDDYEGINIENGEQPLYRRAKVDVYQQEKTSVAWIYWYNHSIDGMPIVETGDVYTYLQNKNKS